MPPKPTKGTFDFTIDSIFSYNSSLDNNNDANISYISVSQPYDLTHQVDQNDEIERIIQEIVSRGDFTEEELLEAEAEIRKNHGNAMDSEMAQLEVLRLQAENLKNTGYFEMEEQLKIAAKKLKKTNVLIITEKDLIVTAAKQRHVRLAQDHGTKNSQTKGARMQWTIFAVVFMVVPLLVIVFYVTNKTGQIENSEFSSTVIVGHFSSSWSTTSYIIATKTTTKSLQTMYTTYVLNNKTLLLSKIFSGANLHGKGVLLGPVNVPINMSLIFNMTILGIVSTEYSSILRVTNNPKVDTGSGARMPIIVLRPGSSSLCIGYDGPNPPYSNSGPDVLYYCTGKVTGLIVPINKPVQIILQIAGSRLTVFIDGIIVTVFELPGPPYTGGAELFCGDNFYTPANVVIPFIAIAQ